MNPLHPTTGLPGFGWRTALLVIAVLWLPPALLYGAYLDNPRVFDDITMPLGAMLDAPPKGFTLRVVAHWAFWFNGQISGHSLAGLRVGNLLLHLGVVLAVFFVGRSLLAAAHGPGRPQPRHTRLAVLAALLFALHPVAVYGVAYLVQRSILLATLFALLTVALHLQAQTRARPWLFLPAALCYLLSTLSKEYGIMLPVWLVLLSGWLHAHGMRWKWRWSAAFLLYGTVFALILWARHGVGVSVASGAGAGSGVGVGALYEYTTSTFSTLPERPHLTSAATQMVMFFRYLAHWVLPFPQWMSIDIQTDLPRYVLPWWGLGAAMLFGGLALWMLRTTFRTEGRYGLAALIYLWPAILFGTELWASRLTEVMVLYRSYLWYPLLFVGLLALIEKPLTSLDTRRARSGVVAICVLALLGLAAKDRLDSLSSGYRTWNDAATKNAGVSWPAAARSFNWAGLHQAEAGQMNEARRLFDVALATNPNDVHIYCNLALFHYQTGRRDLTWSVLARAREIEPDNSCVRQWDRYLPKP